MVKRFAFTMIELIFAIVIIAITVLSLPMVSQVTSKGVETNILQEAIFASIAELNQAISYSWDERSLDDGNTTRVINTTGVCVNNPASIRNRLMPGHIAQPLHRRCLDNTTTTPTATLSFGLETGETLNDDLDDAIKASSSMFLGDPTTKEGYKGDYRSQVAVTYAAFGDITAASQNIKQITITVRDENGNTLTSLYAYSANVGEVDFYKRGF